MKKHTVILLSMIVAIMCVFALCTTSCKKSSKNNPTADSGVFLFHLHTQIIDSTIGGNTDGADSNTTGPGASPWYLDGLGRRIELFVPQFFISGIMLVNANGTMLSLNNVVLLKGLDSEDYYLCKVPIGTYTSAMFQVGLNASVGSGPTPNILPPTTLFVTDGNPYPVESSMWLGSTTAGYNGMLITGAYDTSAGATGVNPVPFNFAIPNSLTYTPANEIVLPTRGTGAYTNYPVYILTAGGTQYVHILCDYGKLLTSIVNLKTNNSTATNPSLADSLANNLTGMFRYEQ